MGVTPAISTLDTWKSMEQLIRQGTKLIKTVYVLILSCRVVTTNVC
jgi:hypothetical protein